MWDWIGFGAHKVPLPDNASPEERVERSKAMLARVLELETTVAFVGSGLSCVLGYPTWAELVEEVVERTLHAVRTDPRADKSSGDVQRLERFLDILTVGENVDEKRMMSFVTACQRILERGNRAKEVYHPYLKERFAPPAQGRRHPDNPYHALLELPIHRFATTNYDCELELALHHQRHIARERFGLESLDDASNIPQAGERLSFTQQSQYCAEMAAFPIAWTKENADMVSIAMGVLMSLNPSSPASATTRDGTSLSNE